MKIARHYKPELVASQDDERFQLWDPYLDVAARRLVATDGFRLVAVPVEVDPGEVSGYVSRDLLKIGRKKASDGEAVEIKDRVDLIPHEIQWPVNGAREFPDWKAVVPPFRQGDEGTITIGLNARLLRGIADALGGSGQVALTVKLDSLSTAPIVVRSFAGDADEVAVLMPCRVDTKTGEAAPPAPVVDLPPTESEKRKAAKEAGADPDEPESMDLPGVPPAVPPAARLEWMTERAGLHAASVPTGRYVLQASDRGWSATWAPWKGKSKTLATATGEAEARDACERHNVERLADAILANAGDGALAKKELKGPAVARKAKKGGRS